MSKARITWIGVVRCTSETERRQRQRNDQQQADDARVRGINKARNIGGGTR